MIIRIAKPKIAANFAFVQASNALQKGERGASAYYVCDGTADDVQIQDAMDSYDSVVLSDGTFNLATTITGTKSIIGQGTNTVINMAGSLETALDLGGSFSQIGSNDVTADVVAGTSTISTTSDLTGSLSVGDYFMLGSTENWHNLRGQYTKGEMLQIATINATTITTVEPIWLDYSTEGDDYTRIYKYNFVENLKVQGFNVNYGTAISTIMMKVQACKNPLISDIVIDGADDASMGLSVINSLDAKIQNSQSYNVGDVSFSGFQLGYGFYFSGSYNTLVSGCSGKDNKHTFDMDKANWQAVNSNAKVIGCTNAGNSINEPFTNHGGAYNTLFEKCKHLITLEDANNGQGIGFLLRGVKTTVKNCEVSGVISNSYTQAGVKVGENIQQGGTGVNGDGRSAEDLLIQDSIIALTRNTGGAFTSTSNGDFIDIATSCNNTKILRNVFSGLQNTGILIRGNENQDIEIEDNTMTFNTQRSGEKIVNIVPQSGANVANSISFQNNTVSNANDTSTPYVKGSITNYTELNNNVI